MCQKLFVLVHWFADKTEMIFQTDEGRWPFIIHPKEEKRCRRGGGKREIMCKIRGFVEH